MEIKELLILNAEGLIPGPGESEEAFLARVTAVKSSCSPEMGAEWHWASEQLRLLFDFSPRWCTVTRSAQGLTPWQAAATWIDAHGVSRIQLHSSRWIRWFVNQREIVAHEAVHAARAAFEEPRFEELFAYLTADRSWRRVLGPLFRTPREALWLVVFLITGSFLQLLEAFLGYPFFSQGWFLSAALCCLTWGMRLARTRLHMLRAYQRLIPRVRDPNKIRALLLRLTDQEIETLASGKDLKITDELRWTLIKAAYLRDDL
jgi:hypothetical protein